jgi:hypothetical protein
MLNLNTGRSDWIASGSSRFTREVRATFGHGIGGCVCSRAGVECLEKKCVYLAGNRKSAVTDWPDTGQLTPDTGRCFSLRLDRV